MHGIFHVTFLDFFSDSDFDFSRLVRAMAAAMTAGSAATAAAVVSVLTVPASSVSTFSVPARFSGDADLNRLTWSRMTGVRVRIAISSAYKCGRGGWKGRERIQSSRIFQKEEAEEYDVVNIGEKKEAVIFLFYI